MCHSFSVFFAPFHLSACYSIELVSPQSALQLRGIRSTLACDWIGIDNIEKEKEGGRETVIQIKEGTNKESRLNGVIDKWMDRENEWKMEMESCWRRCLQVGDGRSAHGDKR